MEKKKIEKESEHDFESSTRNIWTWCTWCACVCVCVRVCMYVRGIELHGAGWSVYLSDDARVLSGVCHPMQRVLTIDFRDKKEKSVAFPALHVRAALSLPLSADPLFAAAERRE